MNLTFSSLFIVFYKGTRPLVIIIDLEYSYMNRARKQQELINRDELGKMKARYLTQDNIKRHSAQDCASPYSL